MRAEHMLGQATVQKWLGVLCRLVASEVFGGDSNLWDIKVFDRPCIQQHSMGGFTNGHKLSRDCTGGREVKLLTFGSLRRKAAFRSRTPKARDALCSELKRKV